jgi:hypothetical protein
MRQKHRVFNLILIAALIIIAAPIETTIAQSASTKTVSITITVKVPDNTPGADTISMRKGLYFGSNEEEVTMTSSGNNTFSTTINAPKDSILRYRYSRNADWDKEESYVYRDGKYRTRELLAKENLVINEVIAKWEDLPLLAGATGTLTGSVTNAAGQPVMGLVVSAGPFQTASLWDGTYKILGVPAGTCAVTLRADNGEYAAQVIQATIPADGIATQNFTVTAATMASITFKVKVPANSPAGAQPRLFGDTYHLGMFPSFEGPGIDSSKMLSMTTAGDGIWTYTTTLGDGNSFQYLYTLGDFRINQERDFGDNNVVHTLTALGSTMTINDTVTAWKASYQIAFNFEVQSPTSDTVYITSDGWDGWEPILMWPQGSNKWKYTWYADSWYAGHTLKYKYIRNGDPAIGTEKLNPDTNFSFREIVIPASDIAVSDTITSWRHQLKETLPDPVVLNYTGPIPDRVSGQPFQQGIEFTDYWRSAWMPLVEPTVKRLVDKNVQWAQIASIQNIISIDPTIVEFTGNSFRTEELVSHIRALHAQGLKVAIRAEAYPDNNSELFAENTAFSRSNTNEWYDAFFEQVKNVVMYNTKIAKQENVEMLMLSVPGWKDDTKPATAAYINKKWKDIVVAVRAEYPEVILTNDNYSDRLQYDWFGDLDYIGDVWWWPLATNKANTNFASMKAKALLILKNTYLPSYQRFNKPFIFSELSYYSADGSATQIIDDAKTSDYDPETPSVLSDWKEQADAYEAVLWAFAETPWVQGVYSFGYSYSDHDSKNATIRGKTAEEVLKQIYGLFSK